MNISVLLSIVSIILILGLSIAMIYSIRLTGLFFKLTNKNIQESVQIKSIVFTPSAESMVELAVEIWRLEKKLLKESGSFSEDQNKKFVNSILKLKRYLDKNDISVVDYTDKKYNEGLNVDVISMEKDSGITGSIIKETHEPAILLKGKLIKKAKVIVLEK